MELFRIVVWLDLSPTLFVIFLRNHDPGAYGEFWATAYLNTIMLRYHHLILKYHYFMKIINIRQLRRSIIIYIGLLERTILIKALKP